MIKNVIDMLKSTRVTHPASKTFLAALISNIEDVVKEQTDDSTEVQTLSNVSSALTVAHVKIAGLSIAHTMSTQSGIKKIAQAIIFAGGGAALWALLINPVVGLYSLIHSLMITSAIDTATSQAMKHFVQKQVLLPSEMKELESDFETIKDVITTSKNIIDTQISSKEQEKKEALDPFIKSPENVYRDLIEEAAKLKSDVLSSLLLLLLKSLTNPSLPEKRKFEKSKEMLEMLRIIKDNVGDESVLSSVLKTAASYIFNLPALVYRAITNNSIIHRIKRKTGMETVTREEWGHIENEIDTALSIMQDIVSIEEERMAQKGMEPSLKESALLTALKEEQRMLNMYTYKYDSKDVMDKERQLIDDLNVALQEKDDDAVLSKVKSFLGSVFSKNELTDASRGDIIDMFEQIYDRDIEPHKHRITDPSSHYKNRNIGNLKAAYSFGKGRDVETLEEIFGVSREDMRNAKTGLSREIVFFPDWKEAKKRLASVKEKIMEKVNTMNFYKQNDKYNYNDIYTRWFAGIEETIDYVLKHDAKLYGTGWLY